MPYELLFKGMHSFPSEQQFHEDGTVVNFWEQLRTLPEGQIEEIWALTAPESLGGEWILVGHLELVGPMVTSQFADERMHFNHKRPLIDMTIWPQEWIELAEDF